MGEVGMEVQVEVEASQKGSFMLCGALMSSGEAIPIQ